MFGKLCWCKTFDKYHVCEDHDMCMKDELDMSAAYKENIDQFEMHRKFLNEVFGPNQTFKMHVMKYHYVTYFKLHAGFPKGHPTEPNRFFFNIF